VAYTSDQHLVVKMGTFFAWGLSCIGLGYLLETVVRFLGPSVEQIVPYGIAFVIVSGVFAYLLHRYDPTLNAFSAYLYIRRGLETPVSFAEAKALSFLFAGVNGKWYPLSETSKLPKENRKQYLFDFAARVKINDLPEVPR
jgi:hypothetical protein